MGSGGSGSETSQHPLLAGQPALGGSPAGWEEAAPSYLFLRGRLVLLEELLPLGGKAAALGLEVLVQPQTVLVHLGLELVLQGHELLLVLPPHALVAGHLLAEL